MGNQNSFPKIPNSEFSYVSMDGAGNGMTYSELKRTTRSSGKPVARIPMAKKRQSNALKLDFGNGSPNPVSTRKQSSGHSQLSRLSDSHNTSSVTTTGFNRFKDERKRASPGTSNLMTRYNTEISTMSVDSDESHARRRQTNRYEGLSMPERVKASEKRTNSITSKSRPNLSTLTVTQPPIVQQTLVEELPPPPPPVQEVGTQKGARKGTKRFGSLNPFMRSNRKSTTGALAVEDDYLMDELPPEPPMNAAEDFDYVDYTIVPLLLRAGLEYDQANKFADVLKNSYSGNKARQMMSNPFELFAALNDEKITLNEDFKFNVVDDKFWKQNEAQAAGDSTGERRTSFVYYKAAEGSRTYRKNKQRQQSAAKTKTMRDRGMSLKSEFAQEQSVSPGDTQEFVVNMDEVRRSLQVLAEAVPRERNTSHARALNPRNGSHLFYEMNTNNTGARDPDEPNI